MKIAIKRFWKRHFIGLRYRQPFVTISFFIVPAIILFVFYFFMVIYPLSSAESIQAGMTLLAEILGVILGAVLVIVVLFIDQFRQSQGLLETASSEYRHLVITNLPLIKKARKQLIREIPKAQKIFEGQDPRIQSINFVSYRKCALALSALSLGFHAEDYEVIIDDVEHVNQIEKSLDQIDKSLDEYWDIDSVSIDLPVNSYRFFQTLSDATDYVELDNWGVSKDAYEFAENISSELWIRGIRPALSRYKSSQEFLNSWLLASTIIMSATTLFISIFAIFGVASTSYRLLSVAIPVYISIFGFLISSFLLLLLVGRMLQIK